MLAGDVSGRCFPEHVHVIKNCFSMFMEKNLMFMKLEAEGKLTRITFPAYGGVWEAGVRYMGRWGGELS